MVADPTDGELGLDAVFDHATGVKGTIEVAGPLDSIGWQVAER